LAGKVSIRPEEQEVPMSRSHDESEAPRVGRRLVSPFELADALGLSSKTVQRLRASGRIPVIWVGPRRPRFDLEEVVEALRRQPPAGRVK